MLISMTGYGAAQVEQDDLAVQVELRSVNNRHLKISMRTSDGLGSLEAKIESTLRSRIHRGSLNVAVRVRQKRQAANVRINRTALDSYYNQLTDALKTLGRSDAEQAVDINALVRLPGVVDDSVLSETSTEQIEQQWKLISLVLDDAIQQFQSMRTEEGRSMEIDMRSNLQQLGQLIDRVEQRSPCVVDRYRQRLTDRVSKILAEHEVQLEPTDIIREVAVFTDRCDISEEVVRFKCHLEQFDVIMANEECAGRKLDFLIQEMNREVNTVGSKANDVEIAQTVVEMKSAIERLREMVQNAE